MLNLRKAKKKKLHSISANKQTNKIQKLTTTTKTIASVKASKENNTKCQARTGYPAKLSFKSEGVRHGTPCKPSTQGESESHQKLRPTRAA